MEDKIYTSNLYALDPGELEDDRDGGYDEYGSLDEDAQSFQAQEEVRKRPAKVNVKDIMATIHTLATVVESLHIQTDRKTFRHKRYP